MKDVILLEDFQGLVFYPPHQIATLTPFLHGWWRAVTLQGEVLHLPHRPDGPWVPLGESWVLPFALQNSPDGWLNKAGFLYHGQLQPQPAPDQPLNPLYAMRTSGAVGELRWFTYRELGFSDPGGRQIGKTQPHILFLVEKRCLEGYARKLADHFGFTYLISGGATKFVDTEFLLYDLLALGIREVDIFSFADFDPEGTALTDGFIPQLERFGMRVKGPPKMVVHPSCFTDRELRLLSLPCPMSSPAAITMTQRWVERTGGIYGQAFGIGSDHLQPIARVIKRLEELGCSP